MFYGWNIYSLYDGQPFPGLAEALRVKDAARVSREVGRIGRALDRMAAELASGRALTKHKKCFSCVLRAKGTPCQTEE